MEGVLDSFVLWSGWIAAVGIAIYEILKVYRNRVRIHVFLNIVDDADICIEIHNLGRLPVTLIEGGLVYTNGDETIENSSPEFPFILHNHEGWSLCFNMKELAEELKSAETEIEYAYFMDGSGRLYIHRPGIEIKHLLRELVEV